MKYLTPFDRRPDDKPFYIDANCRTCGTALVLDSLFQDPSTPESEIWWDAWICPDCQNGVHLDWPQENCLDSFKAEIHDTLPPDALETIPPDTNPE